MSRSAERKRFTAPAEQTPGLQRRRLHIQTQVAIDLGNRLSAAAQAGDVGSLKRLLRETTSPSGPDGSNVTALITDDTDRTPLTAALQAGQVETSRLLIEAGYACDLSALDYAMTKDVVHDMVKMLVSTAGLTPEVRHWAQIIHRNDPDLFLALAGTTDPIFLKNLLNEPFSSNCVTYLGAALLNNTKSASLIKAMVEHGADVNQGSGWAQRMPLQLAVATHNYHAASVLVLARADPDKLSARMLAEYSGSCFVNLLSKF